jgi:transmembrane sensor
MNKEKLQRLLHQYFNNTISEADCLELLEHLNKTSSDEVTEVIDQELSMLDEGPAFKGAQAQDVFNRIKTDPRFINDHDIAEDDQPETIKFYQQRWLQIAAMLLVFCTAGILIFTKQHKPVVTNVQIVKTKPAVIVPGTNKATLTMANGKVILLEGVANGLLDKSDASIVRKTEKGKITYTNISNITADNEIAYNTLSTPKGGEYQLVLPDGTKVWLNAASSISFPVAFTGNRRHVKLTGEAYFEVAKNKQKPFYVSINKVEVRVLGTHFNISAYNDDNEITTTLLEGAVQVTKNNSQSLLKPGQQAVIGNASDNIMVSAADVDDAIAWKNGYFTFNDDDITGIMKKVSRWYDVDIIYKGGTGNQKFGGTFYRSKSITELLHHLEKIGKIHFTTEGRRIIVMD